MPGLSFYSLRVRAEQALTKPAKKLGESYSHISNPVPAAKACDLNHIKKWSPGGHCPDPVPAQPAEEYQGESFKPNEGFSIDPIPARSA